MSDDVATKILLVVKDPIREAHFLQKMSDLFVTFCIVSSLQEAVIHAAEEPHCGILVDMQVIIKIPASIKTGVEDLLNGLPGATINYHCSRTDVRFLPRGSLASSCLNLDEFARLCSIFNPKIIFSRGREPIHLNVLLDISPDFIDPFKTVCIDISTGGCFLFYSGDDISLGSTVWIKMSETDPHKCIVCWMREWGTTQEIPGIGVKFEKALDRLHLF